METIINLDKAPLGDRCKIVTTNIHKIRAKQQMDRFLARLRKKNGTTKY